MTIITIIKNTDDNNNDGDDKTMRLRKNCEMKNGQKDSRMSCKFTL